MFRSNWFGFEEWKSQGLTISSTTSTEAVKLYDAAVTQYADWYDDPALGGLSGTLEKIYQTDPNFILAKAFTLCVQLIGYTKSYYHDKLIQESVDELEKLAEDRKNQITEREYKHVQAVSKMARFQWNGAIDIWEDILHDHPTDMHALKIAFFVNFYLGQKQRNYKMISKVYKHYQKDSVPFQSLMHGLYAFVLEETGHYIEAENLALLGLYKNPYDGWATHTIAHVYEMRGRFKEGVDFMTIRTNLWTKSTHLACHNFWHLALFNISIDDFDQANDLFDSEIFPRMSAAQTAFTINDACALLYRLSFINEKKRNLSDQSLETKFKDVYSLSRQYLNKNILGFNDAHLLMSCLGSGQKSEASELLHSLKSSKYAEIQPEQAAITANLMDSMISFDNGQFDVAADKLVSIKDSLVNIGGSDAQRDIFNQLAIVSTFKSTKQSHKKLLQDLLHEREHLKEGDNFFAQIKF